MQFPTRSTLLACFFGLCLGCDPNEPGIADGKDFGDQIVSTDGINLTTTVLFYDDYALTQHFFYYIDVDADVGADYAVYCFDDEFRVMKEAPGSPGLYNILVHSGTPTISGQGYRVEFPIDALDPDYDPDFEFKYWFYSMESLDRMPDSGKEEFVIEGPSDPNEPGIVDDRDFANEEVALSGSNLETSIRFYDDYDPTLSFFYYIDVDADVGADYAVYCYDDEFRVMKEAPGSPGLFNILVHTGTPTVSGANYDISFPLSAINPSNDPNFEFDYWFYSMQSLDRMPDSGKAHFPI